MKNIPARSLFIGTPTHRRRLRWLPLLLAGLLAPSTIFAQSLALDFENLSGNSSSQIWIQFLGGQQVTGTYTDAILGANQQLQANTAYSLDQISDLNISSFSGRVYVSYGAYGLQGMGAPGGSYTPSAANPLDPNYYTRYQYMEPTIAQQSNGSTTVYADLSYIDFTAISLSMSAVYSGTTNVNTTVSNSQQISQNTQQLVNATIGTATSAALAVLPSGASSILPNAQFTRVISPQFSSEATYHDFSGYLGTLASYSFTTPASTGTATAGATPYPAPATTSVVLNGTFVGTGTQPSGNVSTQAQTYNFVGAFGADGAITLTALADSGNSDVSWITTGGASHPGVGAAVQIVIAAGALNAQDGIYGNNVGYTVIVNGVSTVYTALGNDVYGRVVGDLLAGLSLGYVGSTVDFNGTPLGQMASSAWWAAGEAQGTAPIYLADGTQVTWSQTPASQAIYFERAQPGNDEYYNGYAAALVGLYNSTTGTVLTTGYGFPLQDRLGNNLLSFNTGVTPNTSVLLSVNADGASALATDIWTGGSGTWSTGSNWSTGAPPVAGASAQFVGTSHAGSYSIDTGADQAVTGLFFNYAAGTFTINNNTVTLSGNVVNSSGAHNTQTINSTIEMAADGIFAAAYGNLVFDDINLSSSTTSTANTVTFFGNYDTTVNGTIADGVHSGGSLVIATTNTDGLTPGSVTLNGANTFTGGVDHQQGILILGNKAALGTGTYTLGNSAATLPATLQASVDLTGVNAVTNAVSLAGDATISGSNAITFSGPVTIAEIPANPSATPATTPQPGSPTITNTVAVEFSGAIGEATPGSSFTKAGSAEMTFSGTTANTFTGLLSVNEGKLSLDKSANVQAYGGDLVIGTGSTTTTATVELKADGQTNAAGSISINTDGTLDVKTFNASAASITMTGGTIAGTGGTITIPSGGSDSTFTFNGVNSDSASIAANLALSGTQNFTIADTQAATEVAITGNITGSSISLTKGGSGSIAWLGTNSLSGSSVTITGGLLETTSLSGVNVAVNGGALATSTSGGLASAPLTVSNVSTSATGALLFALGSGTSSDSIAATTGISLSSGTTFLFRSDLLTGAGTGTFTIMTGSGISVPVGGFSFASIDIKGLTGGFTTDINGNLVFTGTAGVTNTWSGTAGDGQWTTGGNWVGNSAPATGADIVFTGTGTSVNVTTPQTTGGITFDSGATTSFTLSGSNAITLGGDLTNDSAVTQNISADINLNASRTFNAGTGQLNVTGDIALSTTGALANTLTFEGSQNITATGDISDGPGTGGGITMNGTGTLYLDGDSSGTNAFSGLAILQQGITNVMNAYSLGNQAATGTNTLLFEGGTLQLGATMVFGQFRGLNLVDTAIIDTNGFDLTVNGAIYGSGGLTKDGEGNLYLQQINTEITNTYTGDTTINQGTLTIGFAEALGATGGITTVNSGGALVINSAGDFDVSGQSLKLNGMGDNNTNGALHLTVGTSTWEGDITLQSASAIQADANTTLTLAGKVDLSTFDLTLNAVSSGIIDITGSLHGSGGLTVDQGGLVNITSSNALFTGDTTITDGTLSITKGNSLGVAATAGSLTVAPGVGQTAMFQFAGTSDSTITFSTISIAGTGSNASATTGAIYNNSATNNTLVGDITLSAAATISSVLGTLTLTGDIINAGFDLTLTNVAGQMVLSGDISGSGGLTTAGTSTFLLSGDSTYSGATTVIAGTAITAASDNALGAVSGGTNVALGGALMFDGGTAGIDIGAEALSIAGTGIGTGALNNLSGINTYAGAVTFTNSTTIQATAGKLTLSGAITGTNTPLTIQGDGAIYFSGDTSGFSASGTPLIAISSGTFASGSMSTVQISLGTGAQGAFSMPTYSPGDVGNAEQVSLLALAFANSQSATEGGVGLIFDLGANTAASDQINLTNASALNVPIQFYFNNLGYTTGGTYTLMTTANGAFSVPDLSQITFKSNISGLAGTFAGDGSSNFTFTTSSGAAVYDAAGSGSWTTSANWNIGTPAGGSAVSFNVTSSANVDTGGNQYAGGVEFASGSSAVTLANNQLTTYGDVVNNSSVTQTITSDLAIDGDLSINAASGDLALGDIALSANTDQHALTFTGTNDTTVSGVISNGSATAGAVLKTGTGTTTWSGANTFTGTTTVTGGTLVVDGSTAAGNTITVGPTGTIAGSGTASGELIVSGTISPGNSPGTFTTGDQQWLEGGDYNWQITNVTGAGTGYDTIAITGSLDLSSLDVGDFSINIWSLASTGPDVNGNVSNFVDSQNYSWTIVSTTQGLIGFNAADFVIHTSANNGTAGFSNTFTGDFAVAQSGNNLVLNYTAAVPEPSTYALLALGAIVLFLARRRTLRAAKN